MSPTRWWWIALALGSGSAGYLGQPLTGLPAWMRAGDAFFAAGALLLAWFAFRLLAAPERERMVLGEAEESRA